MICLVVISREPGVPRVFSPSPSLLNILKNIYKPLLLVSPDKPTAEDFPRILRYINLKWPSCGRAGETGPPYIKCQYVKLWGVTPKYFFLSSGAPGGPQHIPDPALGTRGPDTDYEMSPYAGLWFRCAFLPLQWLIMGVFHWNIQIIVCVTCRVFIFIFPLLLLCL